MKHFLNKDTIRHHPGVNLRNSIATKLLGYVFSIYLVISVIITVIHMVSEYRRVEKNVIQDLKIFYRNSNPTLAVALWEADREQMSSILNGFVKSPTILGLKISDLSGRYVRTIGQHIDPEKAMRFPEKEEDCVLVQESNSDLFGFEFPIVYTGESGNHQIGSMTLYSSPSVIFSRVKSTYLFIVVNAMIKTVILWIVFLWFSRFLLRRPLSILTAAARKIDLENLEDIQIDTKTTGRNEFKILEEAFNGMVSKLLEARNAAEQYKKKQHQQLEKQVQERTRALSDSEERYRRLVELAPFGIAIHQQATLVFMNAAGKAIFKATEPKPFEHSTLSDSPPDFLRQVIQSVQQKIAANQSVTRPFEKKVIRPDGSTIDLEIVGISFLYNHKPAVQIVFQDITDRKKWETALEKEREQAEKENRAKSKFLANMSHELRTPLNAILGLSRLMTKNQNLNHDQKDNLHIISRSGEHLLDLINEILDMSKIEAQKASVFEEDLDLVSFLEEIKSLFKFQAAKKKVILEFKRSPDIPRYIKTDKAKLRQILTNLISNALKFTEKGNVTVCVSTIAPPVTPPMAKKKITLVFEVKDTGPGILPDDIENIFKPFVQVHTGHKQKEGTGLGLSISLGFAQLLGGTIKVKSRPGSGTAFKLTLPVSPETTCRINKKNPVQMNGLPPLGKYRVLIADANRSNRHLLRQVLFPLGFELKEAQNGLQAVDISCDWQPHLILIDVQMPDMDGDDAMRTLKNAPPDNPPVIIALTANAIEENRRNAKKHGADDFITKPLQENEILEMLFIHLGITSAEKSIKKDQRKKKGIAAHQMQQAIYDLPGELKNDFRTAVIRVDFDIALNLVEAVKKENRFLADFLADLIHGYQFDMLQKLFEEPG